MEKRRAFSRIFALVLILMLLGLSFTYGLAFVEDGQGISLTEIPPTPPMEETVDLSGVIDGDCVVQEDVQQSSFTGILGIDIPSGTTALTTGGECLLEITIEEICFGFPPPPANAYVVGCAYDYGPDGATFNPPIEITIEYDPGLVPDGVAEEDLVIAYYDASAGEWVVLPSTVDAVNHTITAEVSGFSMYAVYAAAPVGYRDIPLNQGWNLVGLPLVPTDPDIEVVLANIMDNVKTVWNYELSNPGNPWTSWAPVWGGDLTEMVDCMGYWIDIKTAATLTVWGTSGLPTPTPTPSPTPTTPLQIHYIDVGQGDSILIDWGEVEVLIDGGRYNDCEPYILDYVDGPLELMVATHPDADHIGGLIEVLDTFVVEHIWLNGDTHTTQTYTDFTEKVNAEEAGGAEVHQAQRGDEIGVSTLTFEVLHPTLPLGSDNNENSIVLKLSFGQVDFLFTGDACSGAEASMLAAGLIDDIDILKVSHHGSKFCSTADFLSAALPELAIISVGNNSYGHPAPETIARLDDVSATVYRTDVSGTILVTTDGISPPTVETEK